MEQQEINSLSDAQVNKLIERIPYLKELKLNDYQQFTLLLEHSKLIELDRGELLLTKGEVGKQIYFLANGRLDVFVEESPGDKALNQVTTGEIIAALSIINHQPRTATLAASTTKSTDKTKVIATEFSLFGELHDFTNIKLQTKIHFLRLVINNIRFKLSSFQQRYPTHRLAQSQATIERYTGEPNTVEELDNLAEQAFALTELLKSWNNETESSLEVPKVEVKQSTKDKILGFFAQKAKE